MLSVCPGTFTRVTLTELSFVSWWSWKSSFNPKTWEEVFNLPSRCFYTFCKHNKSWYKTHALCVERDTFCVLWIDLHLLLKEHTCIQVSAEIVLGNEFMITANWCLESSFAFIFLGYRSYLWKRLETGDVVIHVRSNMTQSVTSPVNADGKKKRQIDSDDQPH